MDEDDDATTTVVSVIIPTWREGRENVEMTVQSVAQQMVDRFRNNIALECIVVEDEHNHVHPTTAAVAPPNVNDDVVNDDKLPMIYHPDCDTANIERVFTDALNTEPLLIKAEYYEHVRSRREPYLGVLRIPSRVGVCACRNRGARESLGSVLIFIDGHVILDPGCISRMVGHVLRNPRALITGKILPIPENGGHGAGKSIDRNLGIVHLTEDRTKDPPYEVPVAGGSMIAVNRDFFLNELQDGFDEGIKRWGFEDIDLSLRCWGVGGRVLCDPQAVLRHKYKVRTDNCTGEEWVYNKMRVAARHFGLKSKEFAIICEKDGPFWTGKAISQLLEDRHEDPDTILLEEQYDLLRILNSSKKGGLTGREVLQKFNIKWSSSSSSSSS